MPAAQPHDQAARAPLASSRDCDLITGEVARTPDLRIMRPQAVRRKAKLAKRGEANSETLVPTQCPNSAELAPDLVEIAAIIM